MVFTDYEEDVLVEEGIGIETAEPAQLIVFNDDINTFDWVIQCFMEILKHDSVQAEQLSLIIDLKGRASVKSGSLTELLPLRLALIDRGLSAVVEE